MNEEKKNLKPKPAANLAECRVADIGLSGFAECQKSGPNLCSYAVPFGYCFLCEYPRLEELLERSQNQPAAAHVSQ